MNLINKFLGYFNLTLIDTNELDTIMGYALSNAIETKMLERKIVTLNSKLRDKEEKLNKIKGIK